MKVSKKDLDWAAAEGLISAAQADALWDAWQSRDTSSPRLETAHVLYYAGALVVISAMGWLLTNAWDALDGAGLASIATIYALCFVLAGRFLWSRPNLKIPGGLLITMAVCMTPMAIYGVERMLGFWPQGNPGSYQGYYVWVKGSWFFLEVGTILAGLVALSFFRFPFLTAPIAFTLWYMSMDLTPLLFGKAEYTWEQRLWVSALFGLLMLLVSYLVDRRTKQDYAFWGYLFGLLAFWGGLSMMQSGSELNKFLYCLINVGLIVLSVLFQRRVFIIFGTMGVLGYLGHLSYDVFANSLLFPFVLTFLGLSVIGLGILYQRYYGLLEQRVLASVPAGIKQLLPGAREER